MPDINRTLVNISNSVVYFKDSPHFLYGEKRTVLLEDIKRYKATFPFKVINTYSVNALNTNGFDTELGFGAAFGLEYGGVSYGDENSISFNLVEASDVESSTIDKFSKVRFSADIQSTNPVRSIQSLDVIAKTVTLDFQSFNGVANTFGINDAHRDGKEYRVIVENQGIFNDFGLLTTNVASQFYSFQSTRSSSALSKADIITAHTNGSVINLPLDNPPYLDYSREGDSIFITFPNTVYEVEQLPPTSLADRLVAYRLVSDGAYYVVNHDLTSYTTKSDMRIQTPKKIQLNVTESSSAIFSGSNLFVQPENFSDADFFATTDETFQYLIDFWDGIPSGCVVESNIQEVVVNDLEDNTFTIKTDIFFANIRPGTEGSATAKLLGLGVDFTDDLQTFVSDTKISYTLPDLGRADSPVVITDLLATDIDAADTTNIQFKIEDNSLVFNRANNLIDNPTFVKQDGDLPASWDASSSGVSLNKDVTKQTAFLHDKSCMLSEADAYVQQFIPISSPTSNYSFSFYGVGNSSIRIKIYEFNNTARLNAFPIFDDSTPDLEFTSQDLTSAFTRHTLRLYNILDFNKSDVSELSYLGTGLPHLKDDTTGIVVRIENRFGGNIYIDAVQFEENSNPSSFSSNYDYALVEYEVGTKSYSTRFDITTLSNSLNTGFMVLDVDEVDLKDTNFPTDNLILSNRRDVLDRYSRHSWAKLYGVKKYVQTSVFHKVRPQHKGEYFLIPKIKDIRSLTFPSNQLVNFQTSLALRETVLDNYVLAEDEDFESITSQYLSISYGLTSTSVFSRTNVLTDPSGKATLPEFRVNSEEMSPVHVVGESGLPGLDIAFYKLSDTSVEIEQGSFVCKFNKSAKYSILYESSSNGSNIDDVTPFLTSSVSANYGASEEEISDPFTHFIIIPREGGNGLMSLTQPIPYNIDYTNNGSAVVSYASGIDNREESLGFYNNTSLTPSIEATLTKGIGDTVFSTTHLDDFNPILNSIAVGIPDRPLLEFSQSFFKDNVGNIFYVDYANRTIELSDTTINEIDISFRYHPISVSSSSRSLYMHRILLFNMLKATQNKIEASSISIQEIDSEAVSSINFPLYFRVHVNARLYVRAQYKNILKSIDLVYRHKRPLT